jgi:hypothetical protein
MRLKKTKTCKKCLAYEQELHDNHKGYCRLGFKTEPLNEPHWDNKYCPYFCKPAEPCPKPMTIKQEIECEHKYGL